MRPEEDRELLVILFAEHRDVRQGQVGKSLVTTEATPVKCPGRAGAAQLRFGEQVHAHRGFVIGRVHRGASPGRNTMSTPASGHFGDVADFVTRIAAEVFVFTKLRRG